MRFYELLSEAKKTSVDDENEALPKNIVMKLKGGYYWEKIPKIEEEYNVDDKLLELVGFYSIKYKEVYALVNPQDEYVLGISIKTDKGVYKINFNAYSADSVSKKYKDQIIEFLNKGKFDATNSKIVQDLGYVQATKTSKIIPKGSYFDTLPSKDIGKGIRVAQVDPETAKNTGLAAHFNALFYDFVLLFHANNTKSDDTISVKVQGPFILDGIASVLKAPTAIRDHIIKYLRSQNYENYSGNFGPIQATKKLIDERFDIKPLNEIGEPIIDFDDGSRLRLLTDNNSIGYYHRQSGMTGGATKKMIALFDKDSNLKFLATVSPKGFNKSVSVLNNETDHHGDVSNKYIRGVNEETSPYLKFMTLLFRNKLSSDFGLERDTAAFEALEWIASNPGDGVGSYYIKFRGNSPQGVPGGDSFGHIYKSLQTMGLITIGSGTGKGGGGTRHVNLTPLGKETLEKFRDNPNKKDMTWMPESDSKVRLKKMYKENFHMISKKLGKATKK